MFLWRTILVIGSGQTSVHRAEATSRERSSKTTARQNIPVMGFAPQSGSVKFLCSATGKGATMNFSTISLEDLRHIADDPTFRQLAGLVLKTVWDVGAKCLRARQRPIPLKVRQNSRAARLRATPKCALGRARRFRARRTTARRRSSHAPSTNNTHTARAVMQIWNQFPALTDSPVQRTEFRV